MNRIENRQARLANVNLRKALELEHNCRIDIRVREDEGTFPESSDEAPIIERLAQGDTWAWCIVSVCAVDDTDPRLIGVDTLAGCSYKSENHFIACDYFKDMMHLSIANLRAIRGE